MQEHLARSILDWQMLRLLITYFRRDEKMDIEGEYAMRKLSFIQLTVFLMLAMMGNLVLSELFSHKFTKQADASIKHSMETDIYYPGDSFLMLLTRLQEKEKGVIVHFSAAAEATVPDRGFIYSVDKEFIQVAKTKSGGDFWIIPIRSITCINTTVSLSMKETVGEN